MEPECSLPCFQERATGPYTEPDASSPHLPILFQIDYDIEIRVMGFQKCCFCQNLNVYSSVYLFIL
jgi:hypothetical protein